MAGAGKTTVLEQRIRLLAKVGKTKLLVITFTKKAAQNILERLGQVPADTYVGTFHAFCFAVLKEHAPEKLKKNFLTEGNSLKIWMVAAQTSKEMKLRVEPKAVVEQIEHLFNEGKHPDTWKDLPGKRALNACCHKAYVKLNQSGNMFFGELTLEVERLVQERIDVREALVKQYPYIMVDEFQDTDDAQVGILKAMVSQGSRLFVVGDPAQSIYTWRGCRPEVLDNFDQVFGETNRVVLDTNFRSNDGILRVANSVLTDMKSNTKMTGVLGDDGVSVHYKKFVSDVEEANYIAETIEGGSDPQDYAVLYRTNGQSGLIQSALAQKKIPFTVSGAAHSFFDFPEVKALVSYLRLSEDEFDVDSLKFVWNRPNRFLKSEWLLSAAASSESNKCGEIIRKVKVVKMGPNQSKNLNHLLSLYGTLRSKSEDPTTVITFLLKHLKYAKYLEDLADKYSKEASDLHRSVNQFRAIAKNFKTVKALMDHIAYTKQLQKESQERHKGVSLSTVHSSKGLEFPKVFLIGAEEGIFPHEKMFTMDEERRLMYVAVTRAERELNISYYAKPSRFIRSYIPTLVREA